MKLSMKRFVKSRSICLPMILCGLSVTPMTMLAQDDGHDGPPNVLVIQREYTKPGKGGSEHEKSESAFARAMAAAKAPDHYIAMTSLSGPDRVLFFSGYKSFAEWEATHKTMEKDLQLGVTLDRLNVADGDLLSATETSVWALRSEQSLNPGNLVGKRYVQIEMFKVKPGHAGEWNQLVNVVTDAYKKGVPDAGWVMFQQVYGTGGNTYIVVMSMASMGDIDHNFAQDKEFVEALGKDGLKKLGELESSCVEEEQTQLFHFSPTMSYVPDSWVKADPDFWKPKMAPAKKAVEAKPAQ